MKKKTKCLAAAAILAGGLLWPQPSIPAPGPSPSGIRSWTWTSVSKIHGYYSEGIQAEDTRFLITPEDPHFKEALPGCLAPLPSGQNWGISSPAEQKPTDTAKVISSGSSCSGLNLFFSLKDTETGDLLLVNNFYGDDPLFRRGNGAVRLLRPGIVDPGCHGHHHPILYRSSLRRPPEFDKWPLRNYNRYDVRIGRTNLNQHRKGNIVEIGNYLDFDFLIRFLEGLQKFLW